MLLGNFFYFSCLVFPLVVYIILSKYHADMGHAQVGDREDFNAMYSVLYDDFKPN